MATLVIHAPYSQVEQNQKQSFDKTVATGIGSGYAIQRSFFEQLIANDKVIVICKTHQKQAVGRLKALIPTEKTKTGMQRYDVFMSGLELVPYTQDNIKLNRNGVTVL